MQNATKKEAHPMIHRIGIPLLKIMHTKKPTSKLE